MTNNSSASDNLEAARYEVPKQEIVVNGAMISCTFAKTGKHYLKVPFCHGIMQSGKNCAHDAHCVPWENIEPFKECLSPHMKKAVSAILQQGNVGDRKELYNSVLQTITHNEINYGKYPVPCILELLDRWFDADEKNTVNDIMSFGWKIKQELTSLLKRLKTSLGEASFQNHFKYLRASSPESQRFVNAEIKQNNAVLEIEKFEKELLRDFSTSFENEDEKFSGVVRRLNRLKDRLLETAAYMDDENIISNLTKNEEFKNELNEFIFEIDKITGEIEGWEENEYHLLTTNSFLVCRCGGIITFLNSGQDYQMATDNIIASIFIMITEFKEACQMAIENYSLVKLDDNQKIQNSYEAALKGLEYFEQSLLENAEGDMPAETAIYVELITHSYNDEYQKQTMSVVSLISLQVASISFLLSTILLSQTERYFESSSSIADTGSAFISFLESLKTGDDLGIISQLGGGIIAQFNNLYTLVISIAGFFYFSYETWIENIRITVFTDTHAHVSQRKLEKTGKLLEGQYIQRYGKEEYNSGNEGRGLMWKEEPGEYIRRLEHKGDNLENEDIKINKFDSLKEEMGYFDPT